LARSSHLVWTLDSLKRVRLGGPDRSSRPVTAPPRNPPCIQTPFHGTRHFPEAGLAGRSDFADSVECSGSACRYSSCTVPLHRLYPGNRVFNVTHRTPALMATEPDQRPDGPPAALHRTAGISEGSLGIATGLLGSCGFF